MFCNHTMGPSLSFSPTEQLTLFLRLYSRSHHCTQKLGKVHCIFTRKTKGVNTMVRNENPNTVFSIFACLFRGSCAQSGRATSVVMQYGSVFTFHQQDLWLSTAYVSTCDLQLSLDRQYTQAAYHNLQSCFPTSTQIPLVPKSFHFFILFPFG